MSPRWLILLSYLLLVLSPALVSPQLAVWKILKTALCITCSATFVLAGCAPREKLMCRIIAFKLKLLCRSYPCINYGAPTQRKCAKPPFGCAPWNIRPLGLCTLTTYCCARGGSVDGEELEKGEKRIGGIWGKLLNSDTSSVKAIVGNRVVDDANLFGGLRGGSTDYLKMIPNDLKFRSKSFLSSKEKFMSLLQKSLTRANSHDEKEGIGKRGDNNDDGGTVPPTQIAYDVIGSNVTDEIYSKMATMTPEEYMKDWPENDTDPDVIEKAIQDQYVKLVSELKAVNKQEVERAGETVRIPGFEEFRGVALGKFPIFE